MEPWNGPATALPSATVDQIVNSFGGIPGLEALAVPPAPGQPYGRAVLFRGGGVEVMLACWRPSAECAPHDHGSSRGTVVFLKGSFEEVQFELVEGELRPGPPRRLVAGDRVRVRPREIHSCRSLDGGLSLHIYAPPISGMKIYDAEERATWTVSEDCGAWLPVEAGQVLAAEGWR
jgi:cysteine dioxygenase